MNMRKRPKTKENRSVSRPRAWRDPVDMEERRGGVRKRKGKERRAK
jgi:hypothetical protein